MSSILIGRKGSQNTSEIKDVLYLILLQGVNHLLPLIVTPYMMLKLGVDGYGYFGFSFAVLQYFILIVDFGFNLSATKRIALVYDNRYMMNKVFTATMFAKILLFVISTIFFFIFCFCFERISCYQKTLLFMFPMLIGATFTFTWLFQGIGKIKIMSIINTISKVLILPLTFIFINDMSDYNIAAFIYSLVYIVTAVVSLIYIRYFRIVSIVSVNFKNIKKEIKESFPLFLSGVATSVYTQLFSVLLGFLCTPSVVGVYTSSERIMRSLCFLLYTPLSQVYYPKFAKWQVDNKHVAILRFKKFVVIVFVIMLFVGFLLYFCSGIISELLGYGYSNIIPLLKIMSVIPVAIGLGGVIGQIGMVAMGNYETKRKFQRVYFLVALLSMLYVLILVPSFFEIGAAIALLLTEYTVLILMYYYYRKR